MTQDETRNRLVVVSADSHVGPSLDSQLRDYCPKRLLKDFDKFSKHSAKQAQMFFEGFYQKCTHPAGSAAFARTFACVGSKDPTARLADMDADGVAANVMFAGGQNGEVLPFVGHGSLRLVSTSAELEVAGARIFNRWLADYCDVSPHRLIGVMQAPIMVSPLEAICEMKFASNLGLRAVNFPAPRSDFPAYNDPSYEDFWSVCEDLEILLCCHVAGGDRALGEVGPGGWLLSMVESGWMGRRALWQMIFGGVFERHPRLKLLFVEQRAAWVRDTLRELDSVYLNDIFDEARRVIPRLPSEYWAENCFVVASFMAPFEAEMRNDIGIGNLMWGGDYPHVEGTWPRTLDSLRFTFAGLPISDIKSILGLNAIRIFRLDAEKLGDVASRIGPLPAQIEEPLHSPPSFRSFAFRTLGSYS